MTTYKELADRMEAGTLFPAQWNELIALLRSLDAQKPIGYWGGAFSIEGGADLYEVEQVSAFGRVYKNLPLYAAPVAAQPPSQPVDPVHVINTAIDAMMRRDATIAAAPVAAQPPSHSVIAGALFDFMGWLTTRKERLCLSSADDASPAVTAITEFAKMRNLSLDNAMVTDWQFGAAQASKPLSDEPNMFWNHDDPESPYRGIGEFLNDEWSQNGIAVGDIRRVQRAIRLPDVMVRVTAVSEDGDIDYIVEGKDAAIDAAIVAQEKA